MVWRCTGRKLLALYSLVQRGGVHNIGHVYDKDPIGSAQNFCLVAKAALDQQNISGDLVNDRNKFETIFNKVVYEVVSLLLRQTQKDEQKLWTSEKKVSMCFLMQLLKTMAVEGYTCSSAEEPLWQASVKSWRRGKSERKTEQRGGAQRVETTKKKTESLLNEVPRRIINARITYQEKKENLDVFFEIMMKSKSTKSIWDTIKGCYTRSTISFYDDGESCADNGGV